MKSGCETQKRSDTREFNSCTLPSRYREGYFIISAPRWQKLNTFTIALSLLPSWKSRKRRCFGRAINTRALKRTYLLQSLSPTLLLPPKAMPRSHRRGTFKTRHSPAPHRRAFHADGQEHGAAVLLPTPVQTPYAIKRSTENIPRKDGWV